MYYISQETTFGTDSTPTSVKGEENESMYSAETEVAKPIAEPVKQENSMPTPPPTTNGHIAHQETTAAIVSPTSQHVSQDAETEIATEVFAEVSTEVHIEEAAEVPAEVSTLSTESTGVQAVVENVTTAPESITAEVNETKVEPETQQRSVPEAFKEITPVAATPSTLPQAESPASIKKQVRANSQSHTSRTSSPAALPSPAAMRHTNMTKDQLKYSVAIMRNLKKHRDVGSFLHPVDTVKLNIPHYNDIITQPMDLTTVDRKLNACEYENVEDFVYDVRLVFNNCYKFNGPESMISMLCQNVESAFEKGLRQMPPSKEPTPPRMSPVSTDGEGKRKKGQARKASTPPPPIRRISEDGRPRREIHPPPSKDYPEPMTTFKRNPRKNDIQMKFCMQTLRELKKSKYKDINFPFLQPVDYVALKIPDYPTIIKHPMDLSTIEKKLNDGDYATPEEFEADIRLMFNNCYTYNPPALPVHNMGKQLEKIFDEKWKDKPAPPVAEPESYLASDEEEVEYDSEDPRDDQIAELERHLAIVSQQLASMKSSKKRKAERQMSRSNSSKLNKSVSGSRDKSSKFGRSSKSGEKRKRPVKSKSEDDILPEFTFEQKKDLSENINNLNGDQLNTVVQIIQSSMPNLDGQGQEEIELDIDSLDRRTLHRLHEFVTGHSLVQNSQRKKQTAKKPRMQYSEEDADRKILELEKTLQKFNAKPDELANVLLIFIGHDSSSNSDSSSSGSDSDDSGSSSD
ncbi:hypothetical protein INT43_004427 [Umbelopsis isabellina]|uniref:Bromodomain-containing protein n=1 Tax=Mortierella isabellina TaxID=91625 RepID=A0A8H7PHZ8_MORIS|nr:hypothetical protein INT43_004427 [Umbelopsis isabellina]